MNNEITIHEKEVQRWIGDKTVLAHDYSESHRNLIVIAHHIKNDIAQHDIIRAFWIGDKIAVSCDLQDGSEGEAFHFLLKERKR